MAEYRSHYSNQGNGRHSVPVGVLGGLDGTDPATAWVEGGTVGGGVAARARSAGGDPAAADCWGIGWRECGGAVEVAAWPCSWSVEVLARALSTPGRCAGVLLGGGDGGSLASVTIAKALAMLPWRSA
jgi:xanthine/CO dehydrogenase XdhC/CoxF family maturation factor